MCTHTRTFTHTFTHPGILTCFYKLPAAHFTFMVWEMIWSQFQLIKSSWIYRWSQPAYPSMRFWKWWQTLRRGTACEKLRTALEPRTWTHVFLFGPWARLSLYAWSASDKFLCLKAFSRRRKLPAFSLLTTSFLQPDHFTTCSNDLLLISRL